MQRRAAGIVGADEVYLRRVEFASELSREGYASATSGLE
jgi:hypothetical protein